MSLTRKKWFLAGLSVAIIAALVVVWFASRFARKFEPLIKQLAVEFLEREFESEVELAELRVTLPNLSPVRILFRNGRGVIGHVSGKGLVLRHKGRRDLPPLFVVSGFRFDLDLGTLLGSQRTVVPLVVLDGMQIQVPPKGQRPDTRRGQGSQGVESRPSVVMDQGLINNGCLVLLPRSADRRPLEFAIHRLQLTGAGLGQAMKYTGTLTNPKPPGDISTDGSFGPWNADTPADTPVAGDYHFTNADLGVFNGIAGILNSTGTFRGTLSSLSVHGEASVPNFRLKKPGNPMPLQTKFEAEVDGTNGNTILKPVLATLGTTSFTISGAVLKHEIQRRRAITLDVSMPKGKLRDLLRLAAKGDDPLMDGEVAMKSKIAIPPVQGKVRTKLILDGGFFIHRGQFRASTQDRIDQLSRRGQGQPRNADVDDVFSRLQGSFHMEDEAIAFRSLSFSVPGAQVSLEGSYDLGEDALDFRGALKLDAKVSQTMTGWKRWVAKPVDPFFAKRGAGTYLPIVVTGSSREPNFGLALRKARKD